MFKLLIALVMKICHLIAFAGGVLAGGALALMFAPKKGEDFRKDIKEKMGGLKKRFDEAMMGCKENCGCGVEEKVHVTLEEE